MPNVTDKYFLRNIIQSLNSHALEENWSATDNLYAARALDSYAVIQLIAALEEKLQIVFNYNDLTFRNLRDLKAIENLLATKYDCKLVPQE